MVILVESLSFLLDLLPLVIILSCRKWEVPNNRFFLLLGHMQSIPLCGWACHVSMFYVSVCPQKGHLSSSSVPHDFLM